MKLTREHNHIHLRWASMALALASCLLAIGVSWALAQPAETLEAAEEEGFCGGFG